MHKQRLTLTALALLPLAAACGTQQAGGSGSVDSKPPVTGIHWNVDSVTVDGKKHRAPEGAYVQLDTKGRAEGNYGCNSFHADASLKGDTVDVGSSQTTEMACQKPAMDFERTLARTLGTGALTMNATAKTLTLTTKSGDRVDLTAERDAPLIGTTWTIDAVVDKNVAQSLPKDVHGKAKLTFGKDGTVHGSLGCNSVRAKAEVRDGHITFGRAATTRKMCPDPVMDTEHTLLRLFDGKDVRYELSHRGLSLTASDGTGVSATADRK